MIPRAFMPARSLAVWCATPGGPPVRLRWQGRTHAVATIEARWRWTEGWWRGADAARRVYYRLVTHAGLRCVVYCDLIDDGWYLEAILD